MLIIGICGASGSGKSTIARHIKKKIPYRSYVLSQDCYYIDYPDMSLKERVQLDYDSPSALDHDLLLSDVQKLQKRKPMTKKTYDYNQYKRVDMDQLIYPPEVLIIEGIHVFYDPRLREQMNLKAYMHVDMDVCLLRRVRRDINRRGRSIDSISKQYLSTVKPAFEQYILRYIYDADIAVIGGAFNTRALDAICAYINNQLG